MIVLCPSCQRRIVVPPDKAAIPNLKARCGGCGAAFALGSAAVPPEPAPGRVAPPAPRLASAAAAVAPAVTPARAPGPLPAAARATVNPPAAVPVQVPVPSAAAPVRSPAAPVAVGSPGAAAPAPAPARPPAPAAAAATSGVPGRRVPRTSWRRCANHPNVASEGVCTSCGRGLCAECVTRGPGGAAICPACDALCLPAAEQERKEQLARARARPLMAELGAVLAYPLTDKVAFVLFAVFVGVFGLAARIAMMGGGFAVLVSQGLLYAYAFTAINRVSAGDTSSFMPHLSDWTDLIAPLRAGIAAMLISSGPLIGLTFLYAWSDLASSVGGGRVAGVVAAPPSPEASPTLPPNVAALLQDDSAPAPGEAADGGEAEGGEAAPGSAQERAEAAALRARLEEMAQARAHPAVPVWALLAFVLALVWKLLYSPIALVAAAISHSFFATLNPLPGLDAIRRMGSTYWTAMAIYTVIAIVEAIFGGVLSLIPLVGTLLQAFVDSYAFLAIGCLLGFAVFKKAAELHLD